MSTCTFKGGPEKSLQQKKKPVYNYTVNTFQFNSKNHMSKQNLEKYHE